MFTMFLNKANKRKIDLFQYLEGSTLLTEMKESMMENLGISEFLINKTIEELNEDFRVFELDHEFQIMTDGNAVSLKQNGGGTSETLVYSYIRDSLIFSMLQHCFFEKFSSVNDFALEHFVSHTSAYKDFKHLKKVLEHYEIEIDKNFQLRGNEQNIREFMITLYLKIFQDENFEFSKEILAIIQKFTEDSWGADHWVQLSEQNKLKQFFFLRVSLTRIKQGHILSKKPFELFRQTEPDPRMLAIWEWLRQEFPNLTEKTLYNEATFLYAFLVAEELLEIDEKKMVRNIHQLREWNHLFIKGVETTFGKAVNLAHITPELTRIHFQLLCFPLRIDNTYGKIDVTYFWETYPELFDFCRGYLLQNKKQAKLWQSREFLFYRYLLLLISEVSLEKLLSPIHVTIDFSFGKKYNQMIKQNMEKLYELNLVFQENITDKTDLVLSDRYFHKFAQIDQIVWLAPPRPIDWSNLTKKILGIRKSKQT